MLAGDVPRELMLLLRSMCLFGNKHRGVRIHLLFLTAAARWDQRAVELSRLFRQTVSKRWREALKTETLVHCPLSALPGPRVLLGRHLQQREDDMTELSENVIGHSLT